MKIILDEMNRMGDALDTHEVKTYVHSLSNRLATKPAIVGLAAGRMGYALRAFIMRLNHMGFNASMIGDTNVPLITTNDIVLVNSSSGETPSILLYVRQARDVGSRVYTTTCNPKSSIGVLSHEVITLPRVDSVQLMKSPYEQFSMLLYDYLVIELSSKLKLDPEFTTHNHSILE